MEESSWCSHTQSVIRRQIWSIGRQIVSSVGIHNIYRIVNVSKSFCVQCFSWRVSLKNPEKSEFQIGKKSPIHTIRKVKFLSKNSILTKLYNFLGKSMLSTTKKCKSPTFSRVFLPQKSLRFSREIKVECLDKKWRFRTVCNLTFSLQFDGMVPKKILYTKTQTLDN